MGQVELRSGRVQGPAVIIPLESTAERGAATEPKSTPAASNRPISFSSGTRLVCRTVFLTTASTVG